MRMIKHLITIFFISLLLKAGIAQEVLTGLSVNPEIKKVQKQDHIQLLHKTFKSSKIEIPAPLPLPFFEDFKQENIYPDTTRWMDNYVFINKNFPLFPPTWGAATFDAINQYGDIYDNANPLQFFADQLTSKPIRLDSIFEPTPRALTPADSIYFSFYFQPQGIGNDPQPQDSLVLDFGFYTGNFEFDRVDSTLFPLDIYGVDTIFPGDTLITPCDPDWGIRILDTLYAGDSVMLPCDSVFIPETQWQSVWSSKGMTLDSFRLINDTSYFKQVILPIIDTTYFRNDFQFRFYNYASISNENLQSWQSNCDYWNIDYILLDKDRSRLDTTHKDITFVGRAESLLKNYESMPAYQYLDDPIGLKKPGLRMYISNLDDGNQTANYSYKVFNDLGNIDTTMTWNAGSGDLPPFNQNGYSTIPPFAFPPVKNFFKIPGNRDSIYFDIHHYLVGDDPALGDTLSFRQKFYNYYAYDDGTPEFGYGLTPAGAQLAYRFELSRRDTLRAVQIYFNKTLSNANVQFFNLAIWNDLDGEPGDIVYLQERQKPVNEDNLYTFHTYHFDSAVPVQGAFYIGWIQMTSKNLNVGFDANNDASNNIYFNSTGSGWERSSFTGSLMIRPVLGKIIKDDELPETKASTDLFRIAPNPPPNGVISLKFFRYPGSTNDIQFIQLEDEVLQQMEIYIFNMLGQIVYQNRYTPSIDLSGLRNGIYVVRILDRVNNTAMSQKLQIRK
jgi:hypothetical protein